MNVHIKNKKLFTLVALAGIAVGVFVGANAGDVPAAHQATPEVYKVIAENDRMRILLATWQPGQKDNSHSHPMAAVYTIQPCHAVITAGNGKKKEVRNKAGSGRVNKPVKSHTFHNIGKTVCQQVLVELKK